MTWLVYLVSFYVNYLRKYTKYYYIQINFQIMSDFIHLLLIVASYLSLLSLIANCSVFYPPITITIANFIATMSLLLSI